jgi:hypothetical protein
MRLAVAVSLLVLMPDCLAGDPRVHRLRCAGDLDLRVGAVTRSRSFLAGVLATCAFLGTFVVLGALVLFGLVAFVIGPHSVGILPEWTNLPVLMLSAGGVGYIAFRVAIWMQEFVTHKWS